MAMATSSMQVAPCCRGPGTWEVAAGTQGESFCRAPWGTFGKEGGAGRPQVPGVLEFRPSTSSGASPPFPEEMETSAPLPFLWEKEQAWRRLSHRAGEEGLERAVEGPPLEAWGPVDPTLL